MNLEVTTFGRGARVSFQVQGPTRADAQRAAEQRLRASIGYVPVGTQFREITKEQQS